MPAALTVREALAVAVALVLTVKVVGPVMAVIVPVMFAFVTD